MPNEAASLDESYQRCLADLKRTALDLISAQLLEEDHDRSLPPGLRAPRASC